MQTLEKTLALREAHRLGWEDYMSQGYTVNRYCPDTQIDLYKAYKEGFAHGYADLDIRR